MSKQPPPSPLLPALLLRLSSTTNFTLDELASHHSKYQKLTASHDHMSLPQFTNLMQIMGVRASSPIIALKVVILKTVIRHCAEREASS